MHKKIEWSTMTFNPIAFFKEQTPLLVAGSLENHNAMTIGWGTIGYLWRKPVIEVFVRPSRYTYQFMEANDYFTLCFLPMSESKIIGQYGTLSGRSVNKDDITGLCPIQIEEGIGYDKAELIILCKKIYRDHLKNELFIDPGIIASYPDQSYHGSYIGEIVAVYQKK